MKFTINTESEMFKLTDNKKPKYVGPELLFKVISERGWHDDFFTVDNEAGISE